MPSGGSNLTVGRALIVCATALLLVAYWRAPAPRPAVPRAAWLLVAAVVVLWGWVAVNASVWGCRDCGGEFAGLSELAAVCVLAVLAAALDPRVRPALVLAVLAGGVACAVLALAGVDGFTAGTANTSAVQGRLAGTFGNPNLLGLSLAFAVPAGLVAFRVHPWRRLIAAGLVLVVAALALTFSRSAMLAAAAGAATVLVLLQPAGSRARRNAILGLVATMLLAGAAYPVFDVLRRDAETPMPDRALRDRDTSGWDATENGMVTVAGAPMANPAPGELEVRAKAAGQGVSHGIGAVAAGGSYELAFEARVTGGGRLGFGLQDALKHQAIAEADTRVSQRWQPLRLRWRPAAGTPNARLYVWASSAARFAIRNVVVAASPSGGPLARTPIPVRLEGSRYDELLALRNAQQRRNVDSRQFAAELALSTFATEPLRGIGWGRFGAVSDARSDYGRLPTHNEYLRFLSELGLIGALLLVLTVLVVAAAAWRGPRDELGTALLGLLVAGAVGLAFANSLATPTVVMALAFAAGGVCARAGARAPAVAAEASPWWPAYFGPRVHPRPLFRLPHLAFAARWTLPRVRPPAAPDVAEWLRRLAPPLRSLPAARVPALTRVAPGLRPLPAIRVPAPARLAPPVDELPRLPLRDAWRSGPIARLLPDGRLPLPAPLVALLGRQAKRAARLSLPLRAGPEVARERKPDVRARHRPALDGVRGAALVAVIVYHATSALPGGFLGVDVFFVLSGYLITSIVVREREVTGGVRLAEFWARRARRLLPAVLLLVAVCAIEASRYEDVSTWALRQSDLLATLFYYANWHFIASDQSYFAAFLGASPVRHAWTLAIEEQFYVFWPLIVVGAYRVARGRRALLAAIAAGTVTSTIAMAVLYEPKDPSRAYFGTDARMSALLIGAGLAVLLQARPEVLSGARGRAVARWAWAPVALALVAAFALATDHSAVYYSGGATAFALLIGLLLFVLEAMPSSRPVRVLTIAPLVWMGRVSYGLYLWHWPMLVWLGDEFPGSELLGVLVPVAATFAVATVSFHLIEQPVRRGRVPSLGLSRRRLAFAAPVALGAVAIATVQLTTLDRGREFGDQLKPIPVLACPGAPPAGSKFTSCERTRGAAGAPVVAVIGDSTAQALYPGLRTAADQRHWHYIEAAVSGCSILPLVLPSEDTAVGISRARECAVQIPDTLARVKARYAPDVWLLSDRWEIVSLATRGGELLRPTDPRRDAPVEAALRSTFANLTAGRSRVLVVLTPPMGQPVDCALRAPQPSECGGAGYRIGDPATARLAKTIRRAAAAFPGKVSVVSVDDVLCPEDGRCPAVIGGTVVRYDGVHYSERFSRKLVPVILDRGVRLGLSRLGTLASG